MDKIWEMLTDSDLYAILQEAEKIDNDFIRIILAELLSRIRKLEQVNFALQALLIEKRLVNETDLRQTIMNAIEFLGAKDLAKEKLVETMKRTGISFQEWVNFTLHGSFDGLPDQRE